MEGLTPIDDLGCLLVDCEAHGAVGTVPMGEWEYGDATELFAQHVRDYQKLARMDNHVL